MKISKAAALVGIAGIGVLAACAKETSPTPVTQKELNPIVGKPTWTGNQMAVVQSRKPVAADPLVTEHRSYRGFERAKRRLSMEEAEKWVADLDHRGFNGLPEKTPGDLLIKTATASPKELATMIGATDHSLQQVAVSEAALRGDAALIPALAAAVHPGAVWTVWLMRDDPQAQTELTAWINSEIAARRYASALYLGDKGVPEAKAVLEEMRLLELPRVASQIYPSAEAARILSERFAANDAIALRKYRASEAALARINTPESYRVLHERASSKDFYVRKRVMTALGTAARHKQQIPSLVAGLDDPEAQVRIEAAKSLAKIGDKSVIPALERAFKNPPPPKPGTGRHKTALDEISKAIEALGGNPSLE